MAQPDYRAQLGEALVQIVDLQVDLQACKDQPVHVESRATESLEKCRESNKGLTKEIAELKEDKEAMIVDLKEAHTQIKFLQKQIKAQP